MKEATTAVLICGAGAAGLTLAIDLARRGVDFRLVEKATTPFSGSRGKGIQPRTLEIFEDLGFVDRLAATGAAYPPVRQYHADGSFEDSLLTEQAEPNPAETAASAARSRSASGSTTMWFLAPPRACTRLPARVPFSYT